MTETTRPPTISVTAKLVPFRDGSEHAADLPGAWYITHGFGKPAAGTYTEVVFAETFEDEDGAPFGPAVLEEAVRIVAAQLYGTAWAFTYGPDEAESAVHRFDLRRRERVVITELEVWA